MWTFTSPRSIVFGEGALAYLKEVEGKRAFIVTDKVIVKLGFVDKVASFLKEAGMEVEVFSEVEPEPSIETMVKGAELAKKYGPDWFVGLGGGSCMDAAKAIWVLYERPDLEVGAISPLEKLGLRKKARLICIPTTSGTGSEATWATIITDAKEQRKMELTSREAVADIAILDPEIPQSMPPSLVAGTGMDVLTHAIEAYVNQWRNDFSDALAIKAVQMVFNYLPRAYKNHEDKEAKEKMHNAATMAGLAFSNSQIGIVHATGHSFGALFKIPHGRTVSVFLPYGIEFSAKEAKERYAEIARAIGIETKTSEEAVKKLVEKVKRLMKELNEPTSIKEMGISWKNYEAKLDDLTNRAMMSSGSIMNPRVPEMEELRKLFICAFNGEKVNF
jgi:alcohol dehydrogenase class IV